MTTAKASVDFIVIPPMSGRRIIAFRGVVSKAPPSGAVSLLSWRNPSARLHCIAEAGREVFFVINHKVEDPDRDNEFHSPFSDAMAKVSYSSSF